MANCVTVEVDVDLDDFNIDDLIEYVRDKGYKVFGDGEGDGNYRKIDDSRYNGTAKFVCRYINDNEGDSLLKDVLYEYLGMGLFNDVDALCEELKKRLR